MNDFQRNEFSTGPWLGTVLCLLMLAGCAAEPGWAEHEWGGAVRNAQMMQMRHASPDTKSDRPVFSDGGIAKSAMDRFQSSYETSSPPQNVMSIGLSGSSLSFGR